MFFSVKENAAQYFVYDEFYLLMQWKVYFNGTRPGSFKYTFIHYYKGLSRLKLDGVGPVDKRPSTD